MMNRKDKPSNKRMLWFVLPLGLGLFWVDSQTTLSSLDHKLAQIIIVLLIYGIMFYAFGDYNDLF